MHGNGASLMHALLTKTQPQNIAAAVPFYGAVPPAADIPKIKAAVLVHHGELDTRLASTWPAATCPKRAPRARPPWL